MSSTETGYDFSGKVALVTGATSGIGRDAALAFARSGASVAFNGRRADKGEELAAEIEALGAQALFVQGDVTDENDVKALVSGVRDKWGRLDFAFNNAGVEGDFQNSTAITPEGYRKVFDINVLGVMLSQKHEIPLMLESGGGSIVNNSSIAGLIGMAGIPVYIASKHAVVGLTKSTALEMAQQGIRVNSVAPGGIKTDMADRFLDEMGMESLDDFGAMHPIGRVGTPEEITDAVLWLASDRSSFVTGQNLAVDGAFTTQ